jgi:hypothetical protein
MGAMAGLAMDAGLAIAAKASMPPDALAAALRQRRTLPFRDHHILGDLGDRFAALEFGHHLRAIRPICRVGVRQAELKT